MRNSDVVVVPSRHEYPEGPLTIYTRPCADMIFKAANPAALANALEELLRSPALYEQLSRNSKSAGDALQIAIKWGDLVHEWLPPTRRK